MRKEEKDWPMIALSCFVFVLLVLCVYYIWGCRDIYQPEIYGKAISMDGGGGSNNVERDEYFWAKYIWTAPTTGTPVVHYLGQLLSSDGDTVLYPGTWMTTMWVPMRYGETYQLRVAGVDSNRVQGPWSIWSEPYTPEENDGLRGILPRTIKM